MGRLGCGLRLTRVLLADDVATPPGLREAGEIVSSDLGYVCVV